MTPRTVHLPLLQVMGKMHGTIPKRPPHDVPEPPDDALEVTQVPAEHVWLLVQALPRRPQLARSVWRLTVL